MPRSPLKILLVADDADCRAMIAEMLSAVDTAEYVFQYAPSFSAGIDALDRQDHDAYLIACRLGAYAGLSLLEYAVERGCTAPMILLTGQNDCELDLRAMEHGAADVMCKDELSPVRLDRVIRHAIEHAQTKLRLQKAASRNRALLEAIPDLTFVLDKDGVIVDFRAPVSSALYRPPQEFINRKVTEVLPPGPAQKIMNSVFRIRATSQMDTIEYALSIKGEERLFEARLALCGKTEILAIVRDITDRVRSMHERNSLQAQLIRSQKLEAVGTLAAGIAHDFNNILLPIMVYSGMVSQSLSEEDARRGQIEQVIASANRAKDLVKQILTFSRHTVQRRFPLNMAPVIKEALKLLRAAIPSTIAIKEQIRCDCGKVLADPSQIHQVLMNLCTNSAQAMSEKGGTLTVALEPFEVSTELASIRPALHPGTYVRLAVSDTGIGMDTVTMDRIFEPFFTTREASQGTGLGLSVVHGIVSTHGGDIIVESEIGKGSKVEVFLPLTNECSELLRSEEWAAIGGGDERILIVDDEPLVGSALGQFLDLIGYAVTVCTSPVDALELFQDSPEEFDLVLTDQTMPKMTGERLAQELKTLRADIPVVLISGYSHNTDEDYNRNLGIHEFMAKPFIGVELARLVRRVLDQPVLQGAG